jgi:hypothetical protein
MAATTTIRVSPDTRDALKALSARLGSSAGEIVAELVHAADDDLLLADAEKCFGEMAEDPSSLAAYRAEMVANEGAFDAPTPDW